jgi:Glycosyltransferase family 87
MASIRGVPLGFVGAFVAVHLAFLGVALLALSSLPIAHRLSFAFVFVIDSFQKSELVLSGALPYRDFAFEYPPLGLLPAVVPRLTTLWSGDSITPYALTYALQSAVASLGTGLLVVRTAGTYGLGSPTRALAIYSVGVAALLPILPFRFDPLPALASTAAVLFVLRDTPAAAGVALGIGTSLKLYPVVLGPLLALRWPLLRGRDAVARFGSTLLLTVGICLTPFIVAAPGAWAGFLSYHEDRGLEIGSAAAGLVALAHVAGLESGPVAVRIASNSYQIESGLAAVALGLVPMVAIIVLGAVYLLAAARSRRETALHGSMRPETIVRFGLAVLLASLLTSKVLSPQFMAWLLPFVPFLSTRCAFVALGAFATTTLLFPFSVERLEALEPAAVIALNARNGLLAALLVVLVASPKSIVSARAVSGSDAPREAAVDE